MAQCIRMGLKTNYYHKHCLHFIICVYNVQFVFDLPSVSHTLRHHPSLYQPIFYLFTRMFCVSVRNLMFFFFSSSENPFSTQHNCCWLGMGRANERWKNFQSLGAHLVSFYHFYFHSYYLFLLSYNTHGAPHISRET